jgi:hypothetical protein
LAVLFVKQQQDHEHDWQCPDRNPTSAKPKVAVHIARLAGEHDAFNASRRSADRLLSHPVKYGLWCARVHWYLLRVKKRGRDPFDKISAYRHSDYQATPMTASGQDLKNPT